MSEKHISEVIHDALSDLEWPCRLANYISEQGDDIYITWYLMGQDDAVRASGVSRRQVQRAQVSIYSAYPVTTEIGTVVTALKAGGLRVTGFGSSAYDSASEMYNSPIMVALPVRAEQIL